MKIRNFLLVGAVGMLCIAAQPQEVNANALTNLDTQSSINIASVDTMQTTELARRDKHPNWEDRGRHQPPPPHYDKHHKPPKPPKYDKHHKPPKPPKHHKNHKPPKPPKHDRHDKPMPPYGHH